MKTRISITLMLLLLSLVISSCGGGSDPIGVLQVSQSAGQETQVQMSSRELWGLWQCTMEPGSSEFDIVPMRTAAFTANVNNLLEATPGNLLIEDLDLIDLYTEGMVNCTIKLKHPLPGLDEYYGFDVWGVFMHNGNGMLNYDGLTYPADPDTGENVGVLHNPDGYTRWFNYTEFNGDTVPILEYWPGGLSNLAAPSATLNPYKIFADGLGLDDDYYEWITIPSNAENRGTFRAGSVNSRRYELEFPIIGGVPVIDFQYAVIATWEPGDPALTGDPVAFEPGDYPTSANCEEAFFVNVTTVGSDLYYVDPGDYGGNFTAMVEVFDWQGGSVGGNGVPNEIERMVFDGNFLTTGTHEVSQAELVSIAQPGTENSSVFQVDISGCTPQAGGETDFWVIVEASGLNGESHYQGFPTEYPDPARRAAFHMGVVNILTEPLGLGVDSIVPGTVPFWSQINGATITGSMFASGATVELRKAGETPVSGTNVLVISGTTIQCDFDLRDVDSGLWDVVVINPSSAEGVLPDGLTIEVWSEEYTLPGSDGSRLPRIAESVVSETVVLATGNNDNSMKYRTFTLDWSASGNIATNSGGNTQLYLSSDPVNDYLYFTIAHPPGEPYLIIYRYDATSGTWTNRYSNNIHLAGIIAFTDPAGGLHTVNSTISAFGHIIHCRANNWGSSWILPPHWFFDSWNDKTLSFGNILAQNSSGTSFVVYEKDRALDPYNPASGPRSARLGIIPQGAWVQPIVVIDETWDAALDSPAITCDTNEILHVAFRRYVDSESQWKIMYKQSTTNGISWGSISTIWQGTDEPDPDYVYIFSDSDDNLHSLFEVDGEILYRNSADGSTWSASETVNLTGYQDQNHCATVTADGELHVVWIRGNPSPGYGEVVHRMRDLL